MEEKILKILQEINGDIIAYEGDNMCQEGILDSLQIMELVTELEDAFGITIDPDLVVIENFANKETIISFVRNIINETESGYIDSNGKSFSDVYKNGWGNRYPDSNIISYYFNYVRPLLPDGKGRRLKMLDFGCSLGANTKFFEGQGFDVYGIDISETAIEKCIDINGFDETHFKACDVLKMDSLRGLFETEFDLIVASEVLYYFSKRDVQRVLGLFRDAMSETGVIYANWVSYGSGTYGKYKGSVGRGEQISVEMTGSVNEPLKVYVLEDKDELMENFNMFHMKQIKRTILELEGDNVSFHFIGTKN